MTILCLHCKSHRSGPVNGKGTSRVLASRRVGSHAPFNGKSARTKTMERYRECVDCGFRWTTVEYAVAAKRGGGNPNFRRKSPRVEHRA